MNTLKVSNAVSLGSVSGIWSRQSVRWPDGQEDNSTRVWWIQANPHFADLRIPISRPNFEGVSTLSECSIAHRDWMSCQHGFSGALNQTSDGWHWMREIDYQHPTAKQDIGTLAFNEVNTSLTTERGADEPYTEIWEKIDDASSTNGQALVLRRKNHRGHALLVAMGSHFIVAIDHRKTTSQSQRIDPLNVEISLGTRSGPISQWTISHSTFPWREGKQLFNGATSQINWRRRALIESEQWQIVEPVAGKLDWVY
jgi:hypothetical protein